MNERSNRMKYEISRRTMLRGFGVTMALPWMESVRVWGDVAKSAKKAKNRRPKGENAMGGAGKDQTEKG